MTFSELVAEIEKRFPEGEYKVSVGVEQEESSRSCKHEPKVKRSIQYSVYVNYRTYTSATPDAVIAELDGVTAKDINGIDAEKLMEIVRPIAPKPKMPF